MDLFYDQSSSWWVIVILSFYEGTRKPHASHKMTINSYLRQIKSDPKNKGTLYSSTLKVGEINVDLFLWSELILVSYSIIVFL